MLIRVRAPLDAGALGEDGDAALALLVVGIQRPFLDLLIVADRAGLLQEVVDERGLAMVDMGDNGNISYVHKRGRFWSEPGAQSRTLLRLRRRGLYRCDSAGAMAAGRQA